MSQLLRPSKSPKQNPAVERWSVVFHFAMQFRPIALAMLLVFTGALTESCGALKSAQQSLSKSPKLTIDPAQVTLEQRTTKAIPGTDGRMLLTIDDITRGQVTTTLSTDEGTVLVPIQSMRLQDKISFEIGLDKYELALTDFDNALIGTDFATFVVSSASGIPLTEDEKIERLIESVAKLRKATFIRDGIEYDADNAAAHLRMKWQASGGAIKTARQFILDIASRSSTSGRPYQIKMPDGRVLDAGQYLYERLDEIEYIRKDQ